MLNILRKITPKFLLSWYHFMWSFFGAVFYGFPARGMTVIAITGTNGKSTTVDMLSRIFKEAGFKTASLSSIRFQIQEKEWQNKIKMTMPGRFVIQQFLRQAKNKKCTHVVLEVTSEGMLQHRHRFMNFHTAVFTNLSKEHIERHGSFENYKNTKGGLFSMVKNTHVINADDKYASFFLNFSAKKIYTYSILSAIENTLGIRGENVKENKGLEFYVQGTQFHLNLLGIFNVENALAAIAVARLQGISLAVCKKALEKIKVVPGRMEEIISLPIRVVVDYAFTPAALEKVYKTLKPVSGKLICVLGAAGGGRDSWKRPVLGKIASESCDIVIITDEDPYEEDPEKIMDEVIAGTKGKAEKVVDRRQAIARALGLAKAGDTIVVTGKGSEDSIAVKGGKKIPWDDRKIVGEEWTKLNNYGKV
ncbi:UDP-N-acetylmuramoyl-L-alanyl-D-glutamate--2,6-diaminopimelate ligase [Patescibacteria group bacterium]|nr:UDP-N-acetylmuramoyl-L-alanyl-D-glutamate--2,6-diaminopimelate ligase [Patescibacteria group bacterium]